MARRRRSKWPRDSRYSTRRGRGRRGQGPRALNVIVVLGLIVAAILLIPRIQGGDRQTRVAGTPSTAQALADSTDAATLRGDWDTALDFALGLARTAPHVSGAQRKLAIAWHNYATGFRTVDDTPRSATRTSLDKIEFEIRALMAADSARVLAESEEEWIAAAEIYARTLEYLGLPLDAYGLYTQIAQRRPDGPALARAHWLRDRLRNPLLAD